MGQGRQPRGGGLRGLVEEMKRRSKEKKGKGSGKKINKGSDHVRSGCDGWN